MFASSDKISDKKYQDLEKFAKTLHYLNTMYYDEKKVSHDEMITHALSGIVKKLDPHTSILPAEAFRQLSQDTKGEFGGVGMILTREKTKLVVVSAIEDTPAFRAGIQSGDEIVVINGQNVEEALKKGSDSLLKGIPGSILAIKIKRKNTPKLLDLKLRREIIKIKSVKSTMLANQQLYIRLSSFQQTSADEFKAALSKYSSKAKGVIVDLRNNPGGLLDRAAHIADLFLDSGIIVSTVGRKNEYIEREFAHKQGTYFQLPVVVIVNKGSASASEILAGALQDHKRALIVGEKSFGKGTVQTLLPLPDGSALKITIAKYLTPNNQAIQSNGIKPDFSIQALAKQVNMASRWTAYSRQFAFKGSIAKDQTLLASMYYLSNWKKNLGTKRSSDKSIQLPRKFQQKFL